MDGWKDNVYQSIEYYTLARNKCHNFCCMQYSLVENEVFSSGFKITNLTERKIERKLVDWLSGEIRQ